MLSKHLISDFLHLVDRVAHVNARFEAILAEDTLRSSEALYLSLDDELSFEVGAELSPDYKCLLRCKGNSTERDRNHVFVDELGSLVLVQHQVALL